MASQDNVVRSESLGSAGISRKAIKTALILGIAVLAQAAGNTLLSKQMKLVSAAVLHAGPSGSMLAQAVGNPLIWVATALLAVFFGLYASALSWADLSLVLPATSFGYVLNEAFASFFLNEQVSLKRWLATFLICLGVAVVAKSGLGGRK